MDGVKVTAFAVDLPTAIRLSDMLSSGTVERSSCRETRPTAKR